MPISDKKKISNQRWDRENMITLGCKVKRKDADKFKAYAARNGKTANTILRDYVLECIDNDDKGGPDDANGTDNQ